MGQRSRPNSGGDHRVSGQSKGQSKFPGRRGVHWNKIWGLGPTEVATNHHQSGGSGVVSAGAGEVILPASIFGGEWGPEQKS